MQSVTVLTINEEGTVCISLTLMPPWQKWCKESVSCRQEGRGRSQKRLLEIYSIIDRNHVLIYIIKCTLISLLKIPNCIWLTPPTLSRTILLLLFSAIANQFADSANPKVVKAKGLLLKISITSSYSGRTRATWSWTWPHFQDITSRSSGSQFPLRIKTHSP